MSYVVVDLDELGRVLARAGHYAGYAKGCNEDMAAEVDRFVQAVQTLLDGGQAVVKIPAGLVERWQSVDAEGSAVLRTEEVARHDWRGRHLFVHGDKTAVVYRHPRGWTFAIHGEDGANPGKRSFPTEDTAKSACEEALLCGELEERS